jgi:hypothetical protein
MMKSVPLLYHRRFHYYLDAIRNVSNGGSFIFDNYLTFVATLAPWERQLIYEMKNGMLSRQLLMLRLALILVCNNC